MKKVAMMCVTAMAVFAMSAASADCTLGWCKANTLSATEKLICADAGLQAADNLMDSLYQEVMSYKGKPGHEGMWSGEVQSDQQDWLKSRNQLSAKNPLMDSYLQRIGELQTTLKSMSQ
ncbi:lysozyme inhibitor LprI family protein [Thiothrix nivea]|uniref:Lysozyme inhibitor LprI-like N-terminal domain-containing protein n=1 Tax=Thiothrix nivea (strain ATCC 35100 / DSM 5205 / JP2) TaxID=870187 RepID=A0A656HH03_THINJ|nr:lysozyme inhibitor LprI family protein [Thiothrix nivea]EIJ36301.1 hypothetical protein Thini_3800 [Thiothrix nivea DSM 5205]